MTSLLEQSKIWELSDSAARNILDKLKDKNITYPVFREKGHRGESVTAHTTREFVFRNKVKDILKQKGYKEHDGARVGSRQDRQTNRFYRALRRVLLMGYDRAFPSPPVFKGVPFGPLPPPDPSPSDDNALGGERRRTTRRHKKHRRHSKGRKKHTKGRRRHTKGHKRHTKKHTKGHKKHRKRRVTRRR